MSPDPVSKETVIAFLESAWCGEHDDCRYCDIGTVRALIQRRADDEEFLAAVRLLLDDPSSREL